MFAGTGNTVIQAVNVLQEHGVQEENIIVLNLFCTPAGKKMVLYNWSCTRIGALWCLFFEC